ncbi:hypothetical protein M408DRAFT_24030, partial [Serendipita vermifera MAFF 305830]
DVYLRVAKDDRGLVVACSKSAEEVLGRKREEVVGKTLVEMVVDDAEGSNVNAIKAALGVGGLGGVDTICAPSNSESAPVKVVYCNLPAMASTKRSKRLKRKNGGAEAVSPNGRVIVLATTELTFFPVLDCVDKDEAAASAWRSKLHTVTVRLRVLQRRPMRNELPGINPNPTPGYPSTSANKGVYGAAAPSSSSGFASSSGQSGSSYGLSTNEMPFNPLSQQMTSPLQLFRSGSSESNSGEGGGIQMAKGYRVEQTGSVNAIDDTVHTDVASPTSSGGYGEPLSAGGAGTRSSPPSIGSSWLYDLEQLRKRNQVLRAELDEVKREQRSKRRSRHSGRFTQGGHGHLQQHQQHQHNLSLTRLDALASASTSGVTAMNAHARLSNPQPPSAISTPWAVSFPANNMGGDGNAGGNQSRHNLSMPPPPPPHQMQTDEGGQKRSWSQTDMHSEWHH